MAFSFSFFPPVVPGTLSCHYDLDLDRMLPSSDVEKKQVLLAAKCTGLYFCPTSRLIGVHVRHGQWVASAEVLLRLEILEHRDSVQPCPHGLQIPLLSSNSTTVRTGTRTYRL